MEKSSVLKKLIRSTYQKVALGTFITGVIAYIVSRTFTGFLINIGLATLLLFMFLFIMVLSVLVKKVLSNAEEGSYDKANIWFYILSILFGLWLSIPFVYYSISTIWISLFITTILFLILSSVGLNTKKDISSWGKFLNRALWITIGLSLLSILLMFFMDITVLNILLNIVVIILFSAYIIYDSKKIFLEAEKIQTEEDLMKGSYYLGVELYIDFINLWIRIMDIVQRVQKN